VEIKPGSGDAELFMAALKQLTVDLAKNMVMDGEGSTKFVTVSVKGAASESDAIRCARAIADSMLCKTAWFGGDPNWGRILAAAGYSGATLWIKYSISNSSGLKHTVTTDVKWIRVYADAGGYLHCEVDKNYTEERTGKITVTCGITSVSCTIIQEAGPFSGSI
jgi:hypothetical protein